MIQLTGTTTIMRFPAAPAVLLMYLLRLTQGFLLGNRNHTRSHLRHPGGLLLQYLSDRSQERLVQPLSSQEEADRLRRRPNGDGDYLCETSSTYLEPDTLPGSSNGRDWTVVHYDHLNPPIKQLIPVGVCTSEMSPPLLPNCPCVCTQEYRTQYVLVWTPYGLRHRDSVLSNRREKRHVLPPFSSMNLISPDTHFSTSVSNTTRVERDLEKVMKDKKDKKQQKRRRKRRVKLNGHHWRFKAFRFASHCKCSPIRV